MIYVSDTPILSGKSNPPEALATGYPAELTKLLKTACRGDYNEKCVHCENYRKDWKQQVIPCEKKIIKRQNIQRGCRRLTQICRETELSVKTLTWDMDSDGDWAENVKGVDDYLYDLEQRK